MNRRPFLRGVATGGLALSAGCLDAIPLTGGRLETDAAFAGYRYEGTDLVVDLREDVDVERVVLLDSEADVEYDAIERPGETVRFQVVFPERLQTYLKNHPALRVRAETPDGDARLSVWEPVHGAVRTVEPLADGRARLEVENQGEAPLLVRFLAIYGDVPNPTVDPQADGIDRSDLPGSPGVVGIDGNRPLSPSRSDLVVAPDETEPYETTYAPFVDPESCGDAERQGMVAVVHGAGGSAAYGFRYRLTGDRTELEGLEATVCRDGDAGG
ncbi:hypothetical protein [Halopiger goleimassiliensis]|uniref:hypothetical protein n=1 Tax=Halopiger goleimassiliensis TaxID=1293048 RepID=UPI000677624F|nr:hypothetical protein [Halopiger goleimassiliensis]